MKLTKWVALALGVVPQVLAKNPHNVQLSIVELDKIDDGNCQNISYNQAWIYLARKFGIDDYVSLGDYDDDKDNGHDTIDMINHQIITAGSLPKLILTIDGSINDDAALSFGKPSFKVDSSQSHELLAKIATIVKKYHHYNKIQLSQEFTLLSRNNTDISQDAFESSSTVQWIQSQDQLELLNQDYNNYNNLEPANLKLINDGFFKHELIQLNKLQDLSLPFSFTFQQDDILLGNLHCLLSLGKKIDFDSVSYKSAKQTLINVIDDLKQRYDITLLITNNTEEDDKYSHQFSKRNAQLTNLFKKSTLGCFNSEEACNQDTNSCSNHGKCIKSKLSDCWSCKCQATVDQTTKRTNYWAGSTCSKKDISSQANLLFWTGLGLILLIAGGVQFLYSIGNEKLPGILDAATNPKKN